MRSFKFYKNEIEQNIEELRVAAFYLLDLIDFSNYDSIVDSIHYNDFTFEEVDAYSFVFSMDYNDEKYILNYDFKTKNGVIFLKDEPNVNLSINVDNKLLNYLDTGNGKIDMSLNAKPKVFNSKTLRKDICDFLYSEMPIIDHLFIFDQSIDVDSTVRAHSLIFIYELNVALDLKGTYKNGDIRIKKLNIFNIKNIPKNEIEYSDINFLGNENSKNIEKAKYFFENILTKEVEDDSISDILEHDGLRVLDEPYMKDLIKINIGIWYSSFILL